jgi:hypothetical protein
MRQTDRPAKDSAGEEEDGKTGLEPNSAQKPDIDAQPEPSLSFAAQLVADDLAMWRDPVKYRHRLKAEVLRKERAVSEPEKARQDWRAARAAFTQWRPFVSDTAQKSKEDLSGYFRAAGADTRRRKGKPAGAGTGAGLATLTSPPRGRGKGGRGKGKATGSAGHSRKPDRPRRGRGKKPPSRHDS